MFGSDAMAAGVMPMAQLNDPEHELMEQAEAEWSRRFGGAVIDPEGNEIPITPDMIQAACAALEEQSITGLHAQNPKH